MKILSIRFRRNEVIEKSFHLITKRFMLKIESLLKSFNISKNTILKVQNE